MTFVSLLVGKENQILSVEEIEKQPGNRVSALFFNHKAPRY